MLDASLEKSEKVWDVLSCCFVWLFVLPAEEELSPVMPPPKWFTWAHRSTAPHLIQAVINFLLTRIYD